MKGRQTLFFSIHPDMIDVFRIVEANLDIHYFQTGMFDSIEVPHYISIFEVPNLGTVPSGDWNQTNSYLVIPKGLTPKLDRISQDKGGVKYAVNQMKNPQSIVLKLSGIFKEGVLVAGKVDTISNDEFSLKAYKVFSSAIKKQFEKIGVFYVSKSAKEKLVSGWRLVTLAGSPKEYDLTLESK